MADVDADGKDEIVYGSMVVDDNGAGLFSTGLRHGDAMHVGDLLPSRPGLEVFGVHESEGQTVVLQTPGMALYDAQSGQIIWSMLPGVDVGRGMAPTSTRATAATSSGAPPPPGWSTARAAYRRRADLVNHAVWWDADLLREIEDANWISKWDWNTSSLVPAHGDRCRGQQRLEGERRTHRRSLRRLARGSDLARRRQHVLRIYSTTIPATNRIYTLMHDPQYGWGSPGRTSPITSRRTGVLPRRGMADPPQPRIVHRDTQPPAFKTLTPSATSLWPPDHRMVPVSLTAALVDLLDPAPTARIVGVSSNEPIDGADDGSTTPDWNITGPLTVDLRAERSGAGTGRVYTIEVEGRDAAGNTIRQAVTVRVPLSQ